MKYSLVSKNISLNSFLYQACQKYGDCTVSWTYLKSLNSFHLIMWDKIHILYYILHTYLFLKLTIFTRFLCVQAWPCFLNFSILLVYVSYFYQDLNYVSYEVFLINCTGCIDIRKMGDFFTPSPLSMDVICVCPLNIYCNYGSNNNIIYDMGLLRLSQWTALYYMTHQGQ